MCHFSTSLLFNFHLKAVLFAYISVLVFVKNKPYTDDVIKSESKRTTVDCGLNSDKGGHLPYTKSLETRCFIELIGMRKITT